jgi:hypothetical protein
MAHFHLDRYFVPDDKNLYDMLDTCGTPIDKLWSYARGFGIIISPDAQDIQNLRSYVARLAVDRSKLLQLFEMNSSQDREEKYSNKVVPDAIAMDQIKAATNAVKDERTTGHHETYVLRQNGADSMEISVNYIDPDLSKAEAMQMREKEVKILIERDGDKLVVRHHSNEKGAEIADSILKKLIPDEIKLKSVKAMSFVGIRDPKKRTKFFRDLAYDMPDFTLRDVPTLRVFRLSAKDDAATSDEEVEDDDVASASIKKIFLSGTDIMHCPEYVDLEKRGFFISAMTWVAEMQSDNNEHYEFTAAFDDPESPTNLSYAATGKYTRDDEGHLRKNKTPLSKFERLALMKALERKALSLHEELTAPESANPDGNKS